jgi:EAL domain-containing protein (putative c-di-GMP-specific phosphodiesterase class I)/GGDEF domain-containing protein
VQRDPATGLLHRRYFLDALRRRLGEPMKAGVRLTAYLEPDKYDAVVSDIGVVAAEEFQALFAALVREQLQPGDIAGGFGGHGIMVLLERGTPRDADAWAMHVVKRVREEVFQVGDKSLSTTCTIGLALVPASLSEPDAPATAAFLLCREGHAQGGNRLAMPEQAAQERRSEDADRQWVRQIKSALMENRFRLVQQPIASLLGDDRSMFDVLVRMLDEKGQEILPSEFMPAAERHDLMKNIDRWVIGASMQFTASRQPGALFVRLSRDTVIDPSLGIWLQNQLKTTRVDASSIVFQVPAEVAASQLKPVVDLEQSLHASGFRFAIEGFGGTRDPEQLLAHLKPDFVKIHGALIQGLATDQDKQSRVKDLVELARGRGAVTVAERVEDANTMAVLWQLGVEFIQGFFVNAPEEVVLG